MNSEDSRMQKAVEQRKVNSNRLTAKQPLTSLKNQKQWLIGLHKTKG